MMICHLDRVLVAVFLGDVYAVADSPVGCLMSEGCLLDYPEKNECNESCRMVSCINVLNINGQFLNIIPIFCT